MTDPQRAERPVTFHTTIHGGQQAFASENPTFVQHNYGADRPVEEFQRLLVEIKRRLDEFADPEPARQQVAVIEREVADRRDDKTRVLAAMRTLAALTTAGTALAEAVARAAELVSRYWPLWPR